MIFRINGVKPENSSERLSFLEKNYPQLISEYFTSKLDETWFNFFRILIIIII